jgi:hypothetical protein
MSAQKFVNSNERIHRRLMDGGNTTMAMTVAPLETSPRPCCWVAACADTEIRRMAARL